MSDKLSPDKLSFLIDQDGRRISGADIARLREQVAPPGPMHARPAFDGHIAFGMDPYRLAGIMLAADGGSSREWFILAEQIEELFPHYLAVLTKRRRQVTQLPITVIDAEDDPTCKLHGDFVRAWLKTRILQRALFDMTDAIGKGFSVTEIIWDTAPGRIAPGKLLHRAAKNFETSWEDGETIWLRTENGFEDLAEHKFVLHEHASKTGAVVRGGLTRQVAFLWMYATYTSRDWALFVQGYGMPIRVGRYGPEASDTDRNVLWRAVSSIAGDVAAIVPKSMEIEFVKDGDRVGGSHLYSGRMDWLNREVSKLVLGSTAGTEAISGGHAVGQEHRQVEEDVEKFDAALLEHSIKQQLVVPMIAFTFGPQADYPDIRIGRPNEIPLKDLIAGVADLGPLGLKVKASEIRERLQLTAPDDDDTDVIGGAAIPVAKPAIPGLSVTPPAAQEANARSWLGDLIERHSVLGALTRDEAPPDVVEQLTARLAEDAAGAMAGLTKIVRHQFEEAASLNDLVHRISRLDLPQAEFAEAMARGMALANLVGQASLMDELRGRH
jgi:phage gp29-like protein